MEEQVDGKEKLWQIQKEDIPQDYWLDHFFNSGS